MRPNQAGNSPRSPPSLTWRVDGLVLRSAERCRRVFVEGEVTRWDQASGPADYEIEFAAMDPSGARSTQGGRVTSGGGASNQLGLWPPTKPS